MVKGVSEVVTIVLLLIITVAVAGSGYIYISSFTRTITSKAILLTGLASCDQTGNATLFIRNAGQGNVNIIPGGGDTLVLRTGGGTGTPIYDVSPASGILAPGESGRINETLHGCGENGRATCIYTVTVGGSTQQARADCNPQTVVIPCGNGALDVGEVCDSTLFGGQTCASYSCTGGGSLTCSGDCQTIGTSLCLGCPGPDFSIGTTNHATVQLTNPAGSVLLTGSGFSFTYDGQPITVLTAPDIPVGSSATFTLRDSQLAQQRQVANLVVTYTPASGPVVTKTKLNTDFYATDNIGYWNLDTGLTESTGNGRDLSENDPGNSVSLTVGSGGRFGEGLNFVAAGAGDTTYVSTSSPVSLSGDFTIQLWFLPDPTQPETDPTLISLRGTRATFGLATSARGPAYIEFNRVTTSSDNEIGVRAYDSDCLWSGGSGEYSNHQPSFWSGDITLGSWHHLVMSYTASTRVTRLYIDGVFVSSTGSVPININDYTTSGGTLLTPLPDVCTTTNDVFLGLNSINTATARDRYIGVMDDVRVLNYVRPMT